MAVHSVEQVDPGKTPAPPSEEDEPDEDDDPVSTEEPLDEEPELEEPELGKPVSTPMPCCLNHSGEYGSGPVPIQVPP